MRKLVVGFVMVALLAVIAVGTVSAQSKQSGSGASYYDQFVSRVASLLGKQPSEVRTALTTAEKDVIDKAVSDGKLSAQRAARLKARIDQTGRVVFPIHRHGHHLLRLAAHELGMTPKQLRAQLQSGKSIAEIAGPAKIKTLVTDIEQAIKARLDKAVANGWLSKDRASQLESRISGKVQCFVNSHNQGRDCASLGAQTNGK